MTIRDCRLAAIYARKIAERCDDLAKESQHRQRITWKGRDYDVKWELSFNLALGRSDIVVACEAGSSPDEITSRLQWPPHPPDGLHVQELKQRIEERLSALPLDDDWPAVLPTDWTGS